MTNSEGDDRGATYADGSSVVYRASSLNRCQRCLVGLRLGFEAQAAPEKLQAVFARGHRVEDEVVAELRRRGWMIDGQQDTVELEVGSFLPVYIRGHIDGRTDVPPNEEKQQPVLLEIKSCADASWIPWTTQRWEGKDDWELQTSIYQHATQLPMLIVAARVVEGKWTGELDFYLQESPRIALADIEALVEGIEAQVVTGMLPEFCSKKMYGCDLWYLCNHAEDPKSPDVDPRLDELATALDVAREAKKSHEAVEKDLRRQIDEVLGERDGANLERWRITRTDPRRTLNESKVAEALGLPNLNDYKTASGQGSVKVTRRKGHSGTQSGEESSRTPDTGASPPDRPGGEREVERDLLDSGLVAADGSDEDVLHLGDGPQSSGGAVPLDVTLPSDEREASPSA